MGFDSMFVGRIDYQDLEARKRRQDIEGLWESSPIVPDVTMFWSLTGSYDGNYSPLEGFCFDTFCSDEFVVDDTESPSFNAENRANDFANAVYLQASQQKGENILLTMGSDFQFENAMENFDQYDKLIKAVNERAAENDIVDDPFGTYDNLDVFYSTPEDYARAKQEEGIQFAVKNDDFFPYYECENCMMNGYYASRSWLKKLERQSSSLLQIGRQVELLDRLDGGREEKENLRVLDEAVAVVQHHDGVSGTSKQHVADDYAAALKQGGDLAKDYIGKVLGEKMGVGTPRNAPKSGNFTVVFYNGLSSVRRGEVVRIPLEKKEGWCHEVLVGRRRERKKVQTGFQGESLYFVVDEVEGMGAVRYDAREVPCQQQQRTHDDEEENDFPGSITWGYYKSYVAPVATSTSTSTTTDSCLGNLRTVDIEDNLKDHQTLRSSGAYLFVPSTPDELPTMFESNPIPPSNSKNFQQNIVKKVFSTHGPFINQTITTYIDMPDVYDIEYSVKTPVDDGMGKEIIMKSRSPKLTMTPSSQTATGASL